MNEAGFASPASTTLDELVGLRRVSEALARSRRRSRAPASGATRSRRLGRGLDFAEVRGYQPGDDVRLIDWNVTARTQRVHTKVFEEELERPVFLVVDARASMRFGTRGCYKSVLAARLAAVIGWSALAAHDRVGGLVFGDGWHAEVRPASGRRGLMSLFRALIQAQNKVPTPLASRGRRARSPSAVDDRAAAAGAELGRALERLATLAHPGSAVRVLSDFGGLDDRAERALGGALTGLDVLAVRIVDPLDRGLPIGPSLEVAGLPVPGRSSLARVRIGSRRQHDVHRARFERVGHTLDTALVRSRHALLTLETGDPFEVCAARVLGPVRPDAPVTRVMSTQASLDGSGVATGAGRGRD